MDVLLVDEKNIFCLAVVASKNLHEIFLNAAGLFLNVVVRARDTVLKKLLPFAVGEPIVVEKFKLFAKVGNELLFGVNIEIFIPHVSQKAQEFAL